MLVFIWKIINIYGKFFNIEGRVGWGVFGYVCFFFFWYYMGVIRCDLLVCLVGYDFNSY